MWAGHPRCAWGGRLQEASPLRAGVRMPPLLLLLPPRARARAGLPAGQEGNAHSASHGTSAHAPATISLRQLTVDGVSYVCGQPWRYQPSSELAVREHLWKDEAQLGRCGLWKLKVTRKSSQDFCILLGVSRVVSEHPWAMRGWAWRRACPVFLKNAAEFQAKSKRWPVSRASSSQDTLLWRPWTLYHFPSALLCLSVCLSVYVRT